MPFGIGMPGPPPPSLTPEQVAGVSAGATPAGPGATGFSGENGFDPSQFQYTPPQDGQTPPDAMGLSTPEASKGGGWRSKIPLILAGLGAGVGAFTKGGLSDFGVGLASGFANEKYRGARQKEEDTHKEKEQERLLHLQQVEKLKEHIQSIRGDIMDNNGHPFAAEAQKMFDAALQNDKVITPKEAAQIERYLTIADARQGLAKKKEEFTQQKDLENQYSDQELQDKLKTGELVNVKGVGIMTPAQLMTHKDNITQAAMQHQAQMATLKLQKDISEKKQDFTYEDAAKFAAQVLPAMIHDRDPKDKSPVPTIQSIAMQVYQSAHPSGATVGPPPPKPGFSGVTSQMTSTIQAMVAAGKSKQEILAGADDPALQAKLSPIIDMFILAQARQGQAPVAAGGPGLPPPPVTNSYTNK